MKPPRLSGLGEIHRERDRGACAQDVTVHALWCFQEIDEADSVLGAVAAMRPASYLPNVLHFTFLYKFI